MAHCLLGAPLVVIDSNGALWTRCAISMYGKMEKKIHTSGAPCLRCAISVFHTNGVSQTGAPLVYSSGALLPRCAIRINPIYSPFPSSEGCFVNLVVLYPSMYLFAIMEQPSLSQSSSTFATL